MKTNEILENIKARRSVRAYTGQQVSEEDLQAVLEAATYAPSGMHLYGLCLCYRKYVSCGSFSGDRFLLDKSARDDV